MSGKSGPKLIVGALAAVALIPPAASAASFSPGRFAVRGRPLVSARRISDGRFISVFAEPVAVTVDGCRTTTASVRVKRGLASIAARFVCTRVRGTARLVATIRNGAMDGRVSIGKRQRTFTGALVKLKGGLLRGRPRSLALAAVRNADAVTRHPATEVTASHGVKVLRTELLIEFSPRATVGRVNAVLALVGGRIVGSFARSPLITVAIPDPGSLATLDALRRLVGRQPGVAQVDRSPLPQADDLPTGFSPPLQPGPADLALHHLLALRMPAAWNAQKALDLTRRPSLLIDDYFGNGLPDTHVDAILENPSAFLIGAPDKDAHGYHVLGIAAGNHDSDGSSAGLVTGVFPAATHLDVVDLTGALSSSDGLNLLRDEVLARSKVDPHIVISTSLGTPNFVQAHQLGLQWLDFIRENNLEGDVLQATSAGNDSVTEAHARLLVNAVDNSIWSFAALVTRLPHNQTVVPLRNTLVVESVSDSGLPSFDPGCRSGYSDVGGTISGYGDDVYSDLLGSDAGTLSGTSMATPEIAALGEYLWTIAPDLTALQVRRAIEFNFNQQLMACQDQPAADAYAATLSLDHPADLSKTGSPVRFAILDQNHDGRFDEADVSAFADHIFVDPPKTDRDWSRYDLNGDGFTGGDTTTAFDLDTAGSTRAGAPQFGTPTQTVHDTSGNPVQLQFDERHVTDADVLCYYAYSPLYTPAASDDQRDKILGNHCQPPVVITACGTEADSSTSANIGSTQQSFSSNTPSQSIPHCSPSLNLVLPDITAEVKTGTGCPPQGKSACDAKGDAHGTMTASGSAGLHGATIQVDDSGSVSGSVTEASNSVGSASVSADSGISFKVTKACQYTATGTVTDSSSANATVSFPQVNLHGPSGTLLNVTSGSGGANGTLQPGSYALNASAELNGNTDPSALSFSGSAGLSGTITITC